MGNLDFTMRILNPALSSHESLRAAFVLENIDTRAQEAPSPYDRTDALAVKLYDTDGNLVRTMSGFTSQAMMSGSRIDTRHDLDRLEPGQRWTWELDLCQFHYPLPSGDYVVGASFRCHPEGYILESPKVPVRVTALPVTAARVVADNPATQRLHLLLEADDGGHRRRFLHNFNYGTPLAAWYARPVLEGRQAAGAFASAAMEFRSDSFEPCFACWIVWEENSTVHAQMFNWGHAAGSEIAAACPEGARLFPYACHDSKGTLLLFFLRSDGTLVCMRLNDGTLSPVFAQPPHQQPGVLAIAAFAGEVHIVRASSSLRYERFSISGQSLEQRELYRGRLPAADCRIDLFNGTVKALFRDSARGRVLDVVAVPLGAGDAMLRRFDRLDFRHDLKEVSFEIDRRGNVHLLYSTVGNKLYYCFNARGPHMLAQGQDRYFPHLLREKRTYLGYWTIAEGYRYRIFDRRKHGTHLIDFEEHFP